MKLACAPATSPDKWLARLARMRPDVATTASMEANDAAALNAVVSGDAEMGLVRHPSGEKLTQREFPGGVRVHAVGAYHEDVAVLAAQGHDAEYWEAQERIPAREAGQWPRLDPANFPEGAEGAKLMAAVVASGSGPIAELPFPLARLALRKDVILRRLDMAPSTAVSLVWLHQDSLSQVTGQLWQRSALELREALMQEFVGVVRGRGAGSWRQPSVRAKQQASKATRTDGSSHSAKAPRSAKATRSLKSSAPTRSQDSRRRKHR